MPKTFTPKNDALSARQKKLHFLSSDVLPCSSYPPGAEPEARPKPRLEDVWAEAEADTKVDTGMLRHHELSSKLFGRSTPAVATEQVNHRTSRLTPNDFKWHNHPEAMGQRTEAMTHTDRAYQEKCSRLFDRQSPQIRDDYNDEPQRLAREEEEMAEVKRRNNAYYSDLFDRRTPMDCPVQGDPHARRPKLQGSAEDQMIVHQDWTDSKTELMSRHRQPRPEHPTLRKCDELHQARVFGEPSTYQPPEKLDPVTHDNSQKLKSTYGQNTQQIHQAHLRTSITPTEFYEEAEGTKHWEVVELHVSGLPCDATDAQMRNLCQGFDLQLVKVTVELDPVRNLCKGRAKVMVRYNPTRDSINGLVNKLQESKLRVEM